MAEGRRSSSGTSRQHVRGRLKAETVAALVAVLWLVLLAILVAAGGGLPAGLGGLTSAMAIVAALLPLGMIWIAAVAARAARTWREDAARLQAEVDALRHAYVRQSGPTDAASPSPVARRPQAHVSGLAPRGDAAGPGRPALSTRPPERIEPAPTEQQPSLALGGAAEAPREPLSTEEFIRALNFPDNAEDTDGFRALGRALADPGAAKLVRASQDVLTLLSQDGIYMDDLRPDRARPEIWRRFAAGERGRAVAALGGVRDRSSLALSAARMRRDLIFRDAVHHFLRHFDRSFAELAEYATDQEIGDLAETRTARAFMLLARVSGTFD